MKYPAIIFALLLSTGIVAAADKPMKIGVVDLTKVFDGYDLRPELEKQLDALHLSLTAQDRARVEEVGRIEQEMQQLALGTPERLALEEKRKKAVQDAELGRRQSLEKLNVESVKMINRMFSDAEKVVVEIAKEKDFDLILKEQTTDESPDTRTQAIMDISQRVVLFSKPEYDLTQEVVQRLNAIYAAEVADDTKNATPEN